MEKSNTSDGCLLGYYRRCEEIWCLVLGLLVRWSPDSTLLLVTHNGRSLVRVEMICGSLSQVRVWVLVFPVTGKEVSAWDPPVLGSVEDMDSFVGVSGKWGVEEKSG